MIAIAFAFVFPATGCTAPSPDRDTAAGAHLAEAASGDDRVLRVGTSGDYPPFSEWSPADAAPRGFSIALVQAWARDRGHSLHWVRFRWPELLADLGEDRFDLAVSGITIRPERSQAGIFSVPVATSGAVLLMRPDRATPGEAGVEKATAPVGGSASARVRALDTPGRTLAVNAGGHLERVARRLLPATTIEAIPDNASVLDRLADPGVDGIVTDSVEAPLWLARRPELVAIGPLTRDHKAVLLPARRSELAADLDDWLISAEADGALARLRAAHGIPAEATATAGAALLASLDERLSLMPEVARVKAELGRPIEDPSRERRVLESAWRAVERAAGQRGVEPPARAAVERLFGAQIEAAKWIQVRTPLPPLPRRDPQAARRQLDHALRPSLLRIGDRIARLIVRIGEGAHAPATLAATADALSRHGLPVETLRELTAALDDLSGTRDDLSGTRDDRSGTRDDRSLIREGPSGAYEEPRQGAGADR